MFALASVKLVQLLPTLALLGLALTGIENVPVSDRPPPRPPSI